VMHMVSGVTGEMRPGFDAFDLFRATFPAGTVSGAPKLRAIESIDELEPVSRGLYSGSVGYFGHGGSMDQAITIRTIVFGEGGYSYQAGAGLLELGVASGADMTVEAALAKMYWVLGRYKGADVRAQLQLCHRGEQSQALFDLAFEPPHASTSIVEPQPRFLHGGYEPARVRSATLRVMGLTMERQSSEGACRLRIFLNQPGATGRTSLRKPHFAGEFGPDQISTDGTLLAVVSKTVRTVCTPGPVTVTLVGLNCKLSCRSIHMAVYMETE